MVVWSVSYLTGMVLVRIGRVTRTGRGLCGGLGSGWRTGGFGLGWVGLDAGHVMLWRPCEWACVDFIVRCHYFKMVMTPMTNDEGGDGHCGECYK